MFIFKKILNYKYNFICRKDIIYYKLYIKLNIKMDEVYYIKKKKKKLKKKKKIKKKNLIKKKKKKSIKKKKGILK